MDQIEKKIKVKDYLTKSSLPASDYVINPYIGCSHQCKYCYACFMKRFTGHEEPWGSFIDIKECDKPINIKKLEGKSLFLSSVTDCYNQYEQKYGITRKIVEQLVDANCQITISTKSDLILRDMDLLKKCKNLKVAVSLNTLDDGFRSDMDDASSVSDRIHVLRRLHQEGIYTVLFVSPIFPYLTDCKALIEATKDSVCEYWFENLNLRGSYKKVIMDYIATHYPDLYDAYEKIYVHKEMQYWSALAKELEDYCSESGIRYINYFYHKKLVEQKKSRFGGNSN